MPVSCVWEKSCRFPEEGMGVNKVVRLTGIAALMAGLVAYNGGHPAAAAPENPLIGKWHFTGIGTGPATSPSGCSIDMTFTSTQWTQTQGGTTSKGLVTYIPSGTVVYVVDPVGGHYTYVIVDKDHISLDSFAACTYVRVS
jgi:hypothetical protein